ncbi:MAG: hypothetical protein SWY16_03055 [Cyanobacteriota bacterium]|nr:hypothetical protein [Cyanobacteriota bacterium]
MKTQTYTLPQPSIEQIVSQIKTTHRISRSEQASLWQLMRSQNQLNAEEIGQLQRVFDDLQKGFLRVELS